MFRGNKNLPEVPIDFPNFHSLELILNLVKERSTIQIDQSDKLDAKAYSVMTSATALISAALVLEAVLSSLPSTTNTTTLNGFLQIIPLVLLLIAYLGVMIISIAAYNLRKYAQTPDPITLYQKYLEKSERYTKAMVLRSIIEDYKNNEKEIDKKIKWNKWAIKAIWSETILFVAFLLFHVVH